MCRLFFTIAFTLFIQSTLSAWLLVIYLVKEFFPIFWIHLLVFFTLVVSCRHLSLVCCYDPGRVPKKRWPSSQYRSYYYCYSCRSWSRYSQSQHCRRCNMCVLERDHHCVVIGTCVGQKNRRVFVIFLLESCLTAFLACCTLSYLASSFNEIRIHIWRFPSSHLYAWSGFLALLANVLFLMFIDQIVLISNCFTRIHVVQNQITLSKIPLRKWIHWQRLAQVFGSYPCDWFSFW